MLYFLETLMRCLPQTLYECTTQVPCITILPDPNEYLIIPVRLVPVARRDSNFQSIPQPYHSVGVHVRVDDRVVQAVSHGP